MAKKLYADGNNGTVAICEPDADIYNPLSNLNKIYFHSDLNYLCIKHIGNFTKYFPSLGTWAGDEDVISVYKHNLGYTPIMFAIFLSPSELNGMPIVGEFHVQTSGDTNRRSLMIGADDNDIYLRKFDCTAETGLPSFSCEIKFFIMEEV
jgi:hypothetical protein